MQKIKSLLVGSLERATRQVGAQSTWPHVLATAPRSCQPCVPRSLHTSSMSSGSALRSCEEGRARAPQKVVLGDRTNDGAGFGCHHLVFVPSCVAVHTVNVDQLLRSNAFAEGQDLRTTKLKESPEFGSKRLQLRQRVASVCQRCNPCCWLGGVGVGRSIQ